MKIIFIKRILILLTALFVLSCSNKKKEFSKDLHRVIDKFNFHGSILVVEDGDVIFSEGIGFANKERGIKNSPNTKFQIASMSKQITATAIMLLQEDGLLNINDKIGKYIDYKKGKDISIHDLLSNSSGIKNYIYYNNLDQSQVHSLNDIFNIFSHLDLNFEPGTKYEYSNSNWIILSMIIEAVSNKSYQEFLDERIFRPLEMFDTGFTSKYKELQNSSVGYASSSNYVESEYFNPTFSYGAGGIHSTVEDMFKWHKGLYSDLLTTESKNKMFSKQSPQGVYGYGFFIIKENEIVRHNGLVPGFATIIHRDMKNDRLVVILGNKWTLSTESLCNKTISTLNKYY